jgi:DNA-binding transcriptional regulator YhcF (GntR family)
MLSLGTVLWLTTVCEVPDVDRTPPFEQVAGHYRAEIQSGHLAVGDELPSVRRIAGQWNIATATAQRAMDLLRSEGWIESRPGRPSVVAARES